MNVEMINLGSIAEFRNGVNYNKNNFGKGVKVINVADFKDYFKPKYDELGEINPEGIVNEDSLLEKGDILFVRSNGNKDLIGRTLFVDEDHDDITFSAFCIRARFRSENIEPKFYAYLFKTNFIRSTLTAQGNGTNISNLNQGILNKLQVPKLELSVQKKIVDFLSKYDDLIENNSKRISLLEETAESIYKEWFVNFKFPGCEKCEFIDGIPNGWCKVAIKDILMKVNRRKKVKKEEYLDDGDIPVIDQSRTFIGGYTNDKEAEEINVPAIVFGDHTRIVKYIDFNFASGADGTQIIYSNNDMISQQYLYMAIKYIDLSNYSYARHFKYLKEEFIYVPDKNIGIRFTKISKNILCQISCLREQINKLKEARDILIPKLIMGEIEV